MTAAERGETLKTGSHPPFKRLTLNRLILFLQREILVAFGRLQRKGKRERARRRRIIFDGRGSAIVKAEHDFRREIGRRRVNYGGVLTGVLVHRGKALNAHLRLPEGGDKHV